MMNYELLYSQAKEKLETAYNLLPRYPAFNYSQKSPMRILSKMESLVNESKSICYKLKRNGYNSNNIINKCNELLRDIGNYYYWLSSFYTDKANREKENSNLMFKYYVKKSKKCFSNYKRLSGEGTIRERVKNNL